MTNKNRHTRRKYAQSLAKKGFKIFRIKPNKKTPVATGWQKEAASDATPWSNGQDYNIGIACEDSFGIIDIDMKNDVDGEANWKALCDEHDIADSPFQSKTPAKGRHVIYKMPKGVSLSNSTSKIAEGVDVRGLGGYVVAPGSEIDGIMYDVLAKGADIIEMPKALIDLCQKSRVRDEDYSVPVGELDTPDNVARAEAYLKVAREAVEGAGGDGTAFAVSARVREMAISEPKCLDIMMGDWNDRCVPPWTGEELAVKVRNAYSYATSRIGADTPEAQFADDPDSGETVRRPMTKLERMNQNHAVVIIGTSFVIAESYKDAAGKAKVSLYGERAFHVAKVNDFHIDDDGKKHYTSRSWMFSEDRRTYERGFTFNPREVGSADGQFNHWQGWTYAALLGVSDDEAKKRCNLYLKHILNVICRGNVEHYRWIMNHFAQLIQTPWKKPETAIVVVGEKGAGKSLIFDVIGSLAKDNYILTADKRMLLGSFNSHMETALVFQFEEAFWAGDKTAEGKLKLLITAKHHMIERKGFEPYMVGNYARIYVTSNNDWAIPATVDERRFAVFECSSAFIGDKSYFNDLYGQLEANGGEGYRALMTVLMGWKVDQTMVHVPPKTAALGDQKLETLDPIGKWLHTALSDGCIAGVDTGFEDGISWPKGVMVDEAYDAYVDHAKGLGFHFPKDKRGFGRVLVKMLGPCISKKKRVRGGKSQGYMYNFFSLEECRGAFGDWFGQEVFWD